MLEVLNQYAHGFVVVPVVLACRRGGVFAVLQRGPISAEELGEELHANQGHLQVALRLLESLGWIDQRADGHFEANASMAKQSLVPEALLTLLRADMDTYLREGNGGLLTPWIDEVRARWRVEDELLANFFDGLLVVPVLALLAKRGGVKSFQQRGFVDLPKGVREEVVSLFETLGFLQDAAGGFQPTAAGNFMFERAMNLGVAESYRPMLAAMDQLIFGDAASVFAHEATEHESHVGRSINVISSGFQHDRYFAEVDQTLVEIFSREPFSAQPRWVADTGCGDGTFLKRVYETVRDKTPRGKRLTEYPLGLIGIDLNQASLDETARTLSGIDFRMVTGDIGNPAKVAEGLRALGVDPAQVLHIRSFLDHDRPYTAPLDQESLAARSGAHYLGVYADRRGNAIPAAAVVQSLVENLRRWAEVVNEHGLIMLEVHCQDPMVVREHIDQSESLYFDAIESFSQQLMVEADVAIMAAAEAGLFPRRESLRKYPAFLPYCRITLNHFERRPYRVRPARRSDLPSLLQLEEACWLAELRTAGEELLSRIDAHNLGQWVIEMDGNIVGAVYSQRIADAAQLRDCKFRDVTGLNEDAGPVIQLLGLNILPEQQHLGLGDQLLDLMLMRAALQGGVRELVGITRCKSFDGRSFEELTQYVGQRDASGRPIDPNLRFHHSHGAKILGIVENYRPEDANNFGAGVLLSYDLRSLLAQGRPTNAGAGAKLADDAQSQVETCLRTLLGPSRQAAFSWTRPLREMGLDSLNLLEFRAMLQQAFNRPFSTTFFFSHPTLQDIERYLHESSAKAEPSAATTAPERLKPETDRRAPVESRKRVDESQRQGDEDSRLIAVVGMAARFPGCNDVDGFWDILENGRNTIADVPGERWNVDEFYSADPEAPGKIISRRGGFLRKVDEFDASFFNVSPREAEFMDPQHRLLLEMHWEAIEHAGMNANDLRETACGFFVGLSSHDYELLQVANGAEYDLGAHYATGNASSTASGRLAYWFGTRGPAITLDTACSSSLVAVHQAVRSLRSRECNLAMASGVNLILSPRLSIAYSKAGMLSPRGCCSTFDAAADGYVRSEGCAVVVLKRLGDAVRDGDAILSVIRGSAINQDGASNGLTAPSVPAQTALIRSALVDARLNPTDIDYVEAHGTGTQLGDPVEFEALRNVFQADAHRTEPLRLGSVKTNIGHTEAVAGIAGLIKTVLALQHEWMPAHLHFESPNSQIDLDSIPARIPVRCEPWRRDGQPLRAGVSSFGFSGTNSHVIVEQVQELSASAAPAGREIHLLTLSAKSEPALQALVARYAEWLPNHESLDLGDICATANAGRAHHDFRVAFSAVTRDDLGRALRAGSQRAASARRIQSAPRVAFLFTGQGSQYSGMARELYLDEPTFRNTLNECCEILAADLSTPLEKILYPDSSDARLIDETANTQPALFAVEYALARTFQNWGIEPCAVMGHSVGEYVAACIAGVFSLEDGLKLIAARGRLMQSLPREGAMLAILGRAELVVEAVEEAGGTVSIAAFNGPANTVISGRRELVEALGRRLEQNGARVVPLPVSHAFHSDLMEPILPAFREAAQRVRFAPPRLTFGSNLTGDLARAEVSTADYWVDHIRRPVQFAKGIRALAQSGVDVMLEIGPHPVLSAMGRACLESPQSESVQWLHTLARGVSDWEGMVAALGALHERGAAIDWQRFHAGRNWRRVHLPSYPWQHKRHWLTLNARDARQAPPSPSEAPADWFYETRWVPRSRLAEESPVRQQAITKLTSTRPSGQWLIVADGRGVAEALGAKLRSLGDQATLIALPEITESASSGSESGLDNLLDRAREEGQPALRGVIHLASLDAPDNESLGLRDLERAQQLGCESAVKLAQAILARELPDSPKIWLVTRGAQAINAAGGLPSLAQAPIWGVGKVMALEYPDSWGGLIDLGPADDVETIAAMLAREVREPDDEDEIALRAKNCFVSRLTRFMPAASSSVSFKADATYLVTGGLGKIGLKVAQWLVDHGARSLVLVGRTPVSHRLDTPAQSSSLNGYDKAGLIESLRRDGVRVEIHTASVADTDAMGSLFSRFGRDLPPLCGVIHAAGVMETAPIRRIDASDFEAVFPSKISGAWILHELTRELDLDFFVLFSSTASSLGFHGVAAYAAANAFLDALVLTRRASGLPALAINWGWWRGGGSSRQIDEFAGDIGLKQMPAPLALDALSRLLNGDRVRATVACVDWPVFRPIHATKRGRPFLSMLGISEEETHNTVQAWQEPAESFLSRLHCIHSEDAKEQLVRQVRSTVASVLHIDPLEPIDETRGFFTLGLDSLMTGELRNRLQKSLGRKLPATIAFEYPTILKLAEYLFHELGLAASPVAASPARAVVTPITPAGDALDDLEDAELVSILDQELTRVFNPTVLGKNAD